MEVSECFLVLEKTVDTRVFGLVGERNFNNCKQCHARTVLIFNVPSSYFQKNSDQTIAKKRTINYRGGA